MKTVLQEHQKDVGRGCKASLDSAASLESLDRHLPAMDAYLNGARSFIKDRGTLSTAKKHDNRKPQMV